MASPTDRGRRAFPLPPWGAPSAPPTIASVRRSLNQRPANGAKGGIHMPFAIVVGCVLLWLLIGRKKEKNAAGVDARRIGLDEGLVILEGDTD